MIITKAQKIEFARLMGHAYQLHQSGNYCEAEGIYRTVLSLYPAAFEPLYLLGVVCYQTGRSGEAINLIGKAVKINKKSAAAFCHLGAACRAVGRLDDAEKQYRKALALQPDYPDACYNLGNTLAELKRFKDAEREFRKAVRLKPDYAEAHCNLGMLLFAAGKPEEAAASCRQALLYKPDYVKPLYNLVNSLSEVCAWDDFSETDIDRLREVIRNGADTHADIPPFFLLRLPDVTVQEQQLCARKWTERWPAVREADQSRNHNDKIRVGYLSANFGDHVVAQQMIEIFEKHDRAGFSFTAYSFDPGNGTGIMPRLTAAFDHFEDITGRSLKDSAEIIRSHGIDILVDLTGHTKNSCSAVMALRPAPVQVNYLGYPGTLGADCVDYIIADRFVIPPEYRGDYTEEVLWLPDSYMPSDSGMPRPSAPSRSECGLPDDRFVFCSFNQPYKITQEMFSIWCRLMIEVPESVLWMRAFNPYVEINIKRAAKKRGIDEERIIFDPYVSREEHFARLQCADLFLDTAPYNAHATCSNALWMGLPVITCSGRSFASRVAGSLLVTMGVPELVTCTLEDYFSRALSLAKDRDLLDGLKARIIASRDGSPLFDSTRFARNLEGLYKQMWEKHCR